MTESEQLPGKIIAMHCQTIQELTAKLARLRQSNAVLLAALKSALAVGQVVGDSKVALLGAIATAEAHQP